MRVGVAPLAAGALLFFACAKKSKQKKHTPAVRPPHAAGAQSRREFSDGASCPSRKRRTSMCGAPAGFCPPRLPDLRGPGSKSKRVRVRVRARDLHVLLLLLFGAPMRHGERAG